MTWGFSHPGHAALAAALLLAAVQARPVAADAEPVTIRYCVDPDWAPFEIINAFGEHEGIAADLLALVAERAGVRLDLVPTSDWTASIAALQDGRCQALSFLNATPLRETWLAFTEPLFVDPNVIVMREDHPFVGELAYGGPRIMVLPKGTSIEQAVRADYPDIEIVTVASEEEAFRQVSTGAADMTLRSLSVAVHVIRRNGFFNLKVAGRVDGYENRLAMAVREEDAHLLDLLNPAILSLTPQDQREIANRHVSITVNMPFDWRRLAVPGGLAGGALLTSLFWLGRLHRVNRRLRESEARYRGLVDNSYDIAFTLDDSGQIGFVSPSWARLLGHPPEAVLGRRFVTFVHPDDRPATEAAIARVMESGAPARDLAYRIADAGGGWVWQMANATAMLGVDGRPSGLQAHAVDATARKAAEAAQARAARLGRMIEDSLNEIYVVDAETSRFIEVNRGARENLGYGHRDLVTMTPRDIAPELDLHGVAAIVARLRSGEESVATLRTRHRRRNGSFYPVEIRLQLMAGDRPCLVAMAQDTTSRDAAEAALVASRERAEEANRTKSMFLANMSHEIRTPMNGVLGMASALDDLLTDPAQKEMLAVIRQSGELLLGIINDILDLSKIEAGRLDIEAVPFRPADLAGRIEVLHAPRAAGKGVGFVVQASPGADTARIGDPHRVMQILHNLVSNAVKFTEAGTVTVALDAEPGAPLRIEVRDTGIGMTQDQVARMFEAFAQADSSTTRRFGGTGLGMAIVRRLVDGMGGEISVDSRLGEGTSIAVTLPLPLAEAVPPAAEQTPPAATEDLHGLRVLAAEDNAINQTVLRAMLAKLGVEVEMVDDGAAAVEAWASGAFDALLLDISMPVMDGASALAAIRAREAEAGAVPTPAVAVTANALKHQVEAYLEGGFDAHVAKPIDIDALRSTLAAVMAGRRAAASARRPAPDCAA